MPLKVDRHIEKAEGQILETLKADYELDFWVEELEGILQSGKGPNVAVVGDWGTGKTTFLHLLKNEFEDKGYPVVFYEAWRFHADPDPMLSLLQVIKKQFDDDDKGEGKKKKVLIIKLKIR